MEGRVQAVLGGGEDAAFSRSEMEQYLQAIVM